MATEPNLSPPTDTKDSEGTQPTKASQRSPSTKASEGTPATRKPDSGAPQASMPTASRSDADGDVVVDIPQLAVDELNLEIHAPILDQVKLEAKGLHVGLFAKVDLDNVVRLAGKRPASWLPDIEGRESGGEQESGDEDEERAAAEEQLDAEKQRAAEVRDELQHLLESAKDAYEEVSDRNLEDQVRALYDSARDAYARISGRGEDGDDADGAQRDGGQGDGSKRDGQQGHEGWAESVGRRALEFTKHGGKVAGLTAAGVAGGAALESVRHSGGIRLQMPIQRRSSSFPKTVVDTVRDKIG
jgi:hypothetical protein